MNRTDLDKQTRRVRAMYTPEDLRTVFVQRTDDEMFFELGAAELGPVRVAALRSEGLGHLVVWAGFEHLDGGVKWDN